MARVNLGRVMGLSAYEVAKQNGFVGTESDWLASLKGADGTSGTVTVNGTKYSHVNGNITLPNYPTLSSLNGASASHTHTAGQITTDTNHKFVTDAQINSWNNKLSTVDQTLSSTSSNPISNKAVYAAIGNIESTLNSILGV